MQRIAEERTYDIRHVFVQRSIFKTLDLSILAESCYMQGINDMIDAIQQTEILKQKGEGTIYWP